VLRDDGTLWLNIGDSYCTGTTAKRNATSTEGDHVPASWSNRNQDVRVGTPAGLKTKDLLGIPWILAFALRADGWFLRQDIIWSKPNPMPESVTDRCTKAHEYLFLLSKSSRYYFDASAIRTETDWSATDTKMPDGWDTGAGGHGSFHRDGREKGARVRGLPPRHAQYASSDQSGLDDVGRGKGANKRSVWSIATQPFKEAHFATFPPALVEPCILAGCPVGGTVLDPFGGAGTTGLVADRLQRDAVLIELNPEYAAIARRRISGDSPLFAEVA
jgi:DNA modification methylase